MKMTGQGGDSFMTKKVTIFALLVFLIFTLADVLPAQENLIPVTIIRVSQPNVVVAEYCCGKETVKVRIKLAGIKAPLAYPGMTDLLMEKLRKYVNMPGINFDFALGHSSEEKVWVGYLSYDCNCENNDDEIAIINAEVIAEGLAEVNSDTAGKNMINYLLEEQENAYLEKRGLWGIKEKLSEPSKKKKNNCSSCER